MQELTMKRKNVLEIATEAYKQEMMAYAEDYKAFLCSIFKYVCNLVHLHHKGTLTACKVI